MLVKSVKQPYLRPSYLKLVELFSLGHDAEDVSFSPLRVEQFVECLHTQGTFVSKW